MKTLTPGRPKLAMLCFCVLTAVFIGVEFSRDYALDAGTQTAAGELADAGPTPATDPIGDNQFEEIAARPLFYPERRSIVADPAPQAPAEISPPPTLPARELTLSAVILSGEQRIALLQAANESKLQRLVIGESLDGWTVAAIEANQIRLRRGEETRVVEIKLITSTAMPPQEAQPRTRLISRNRMPPARLPPAAPEPGPDTEAGATVEAPASAPGIDSQAAKTQ